LDYDPVFTSRRLYLPRSRRRIDAAAGYGSGIARDRFGIALPDRDHHIAGEQGGRRVADSRLNAIAFSHQFGLAQFGLAQTVLVYAIIRITIGQ
jgi:hypothetical protein